MSSISQYNKLNDNDCISRLYDRNDYAIFELPDRSSDLSDAGKSDDLLPRPQETTDITLSGECIICYEAAPMLFRHICQDSGICEACCERYQETMGYDTKTFHLCPLCTQKTQENEWTELNSRAGQVLITSPSPSYVIVVLRRMRHSLPTLFGYPFLLPLPLLGITGAEIHAAVNNFLSLANMTPTLVSTVRILVCNEYGSNCSSCNDEFCTGCSPIQPTDDIVKLPKGELHATKIKNQS